MPVPAVLDAAELGPGDEVRDAGGDLLVAAGAAVPLALGARAAHRAHRPLLALPALGGPSPAVPPQRRTGMLVGTLAATGAVAARGHRTPHGGCSGTVRFKPRGWHRGQVPGGADGTIPYGIRRDRARE
ncbi:protein of unknown function [Streptomyces sp. KY75]|nr:protein of unknown function [Streptomyces sp. KY75]